MDTMKPDEYGVGFAIEAMEFGYMAEHDLLMLRLSYADGAGGVAQTPRILLSPDQARQLQAGLEKQLAHRAARGQPKH